MRVCGSEPSDSIKGREFLDYLSDLAFHEGFCFIQLISHGANYTDPVFIKSSR